MIWILSQLVLVGHPRFGDVQVWLSVILAVVGGIVFGIGAIWFVGRRLRALLAKGRGDDTH